MLIILLSVRVSHAFEPVVIEFLRYEVCQICGEELQAYYDAYIYNTQVVNNISIHYQNKVQVKWIEWTSDEGHERRNQYNLSLVDWNTIIINHEVVLKGGKQSVNETYAWEIIDFYLAQPLPSPHDIAVTSVVPVSSSISIGETLDINVTVRNEGNETETFNVTLYYGTSNAGTVLVENLESKNETLLIFHWNTSGVAEGNYTISAQADILQNETDTQDNLRSDGVVEVRAPFTPPPIRHDVAVISVAPSNTSTTAGERINITATVRNVGTENETFQVNMYCNETLIGTQTVAELAATEIQNLTFAWDTTNRSIGSYVVRAQAVAVANETFLADNELTYSPILLKAASSPTDPNPSLSLTAMLALAFAFGFFETFSPCLMIMLSFILSYTIGKTTKFKTSFLQVMMFAIGFVSAAAIIGLALGIVFLSLMSVRIYLVYTVCVVAILFGLNLLGILKVPIETKPLIKDMSRRYVATYLGLLFLGFIFYFLDPCIAPIFVSMVPILFSDAFYLILFVFCVGAIIPFIGIGIFAGSVSKLVRSTYKHRSIIRGISGLILIGYSIYLIAIFVSHGFY